MQIYSQWISLMFYLLYQPWAGRVLFLYFFRLYVMDQWSCWSVCFIISKYVCQQSESYHSTSSPSVATMPRRISSISKQSSSSVFWMTCPEAVHPFISRLKVRAQAQKTLWIQYHPVNKRTCTHADKQTTKPAKYIGKNERQKLKAGPRRTKFVWHAFVQQHTGTIVELCCVLSAFQCSVFALFEDKSGQL